MLLMCDLRADTKWLYKHTLPVKITTKAKHT